MALPPLQFFVRGSDGLSLLVGPPFDNSPKARLDRISCTAARFSNDGTKLAVISNDAVSIYDTSTGTELLKLNIAGVTAAIFSPTGTFLQTFQRPTGQQKNVSLWDVKTGALVFQQFQRTMSKSNWPAIQFSEDETVACRLVTNEVHFLDPHDFSKGIIDRLRLQGIEGAQLAFSPPSYVAAYVPEIKGSPASVRIYELAQVSQGQAVARRSFYKASSVQLLWNRGSTGLLIMAQSDVDKSNQSYYGETRLHFLTSNGSHEGSVPLSKEGPVHDVQWSPTGTEFVVVYGFMPARATLFDAKCKALFDFGTGPCNTARWNPHGRFLCIAGFGNLPGDITFWDRSSLKNLGSTRAECSVTSEWSADGRFFLTATTAPRLQIDNGIKIFTYDGSLYFEKKYDKLFQAEWQPALAGVYLDRPGSPDQLMKQGTKPEVAPGKPGNITAKPAAYRPPHTVGASVVRAQLLGEEDATSSGSTGTMSKNSLKNKKRREKQKDRKDALGTDLAGSESSVSAVEKQLEALPAALNGNSEISDEDIAKKVRALNKKLRQIEDIKQKALACGGNLILTPEQQGKLAQEVSLKEEIKKLEDQMGH